MKPNHKSVKFILDNDMYEAFKEDARVNQFRSVPEQIRYLINCHMAEVAKKRINR